MTYSTVLFDFDHTLFDTDGAEAPAFDTTIAQLGLAPNSDHFDAYREINLTLWYSVHAGTLAPSTATLAMVTNALADVQRLRLERLGIEPLFETIVISTEAGSAKPNPAIFDVTFEALGWPDKGGAIIVGDNLGSDIAGGRGYGIDTCWYNPTGRANPTDQAPTHEIRDLNEPIELVGATA